MKKISHALAFLALFCGATASLNAQQTGLRLDVALAHTAYVNGEDLYFDLTIFNSATSPFIVDDYGPYTNNAVRIYIRNDNGTLIFPTKNNGKLTDVMVMGGTSETVTINLRDYFALEPARYRLCVEAKIGANTTMSGLYAFSVVNGIELLSRVKMKEGSNNVSRKFSLLYWSREERNDMFLKITETPGDRVYGFAQLGSTVLVERPTIVFEPGDVVVTTHQATRDTFVRTRIDTSGRHMQLRERELLLKSETVTESINAYRLQEQFNKEKEDDKSNNRRFLNRKRVTPPNP